MVTNCPFGWGRITRQSEIVLENDVSQLTDAALCGIYVTELLRVRSQPNSKRPPAKAVFFVSSAMRRGFLLWWPSGPWI